jgi:tetratricopeptide (TPR) repeat protein
LRRFVQILVLVLLAFSVSSATAQRKRKKKEKGPTYEEAREITALFFEANKQKMLGNFEEAAGGYHECIKIDSKHAASYYELANLLTVSDQLADALPFALRAYELDPSNQWYALFLADIHMGLNDYDSASKLYQLLVDKYPKNVDYLYELATTYLYLNKLEKAIETYNKIEETFGVTEEISVQKEKIYLQLDRLDEAIAELENLISNYPGEQRFLGMLAEVYTANDMPDKAFGVYERMMKNDPDDPVLHLNLAEYYRRKSDYEKSFVELKTAFKSPGLNIDNKIQVMMSYYNLTENDTQLLDQAYELLDLLTKAHPDDAKGFAMKADFLLRDNRLEESRAAFYETVKLDSSRFMVWNQLINTSYELRDYAAMEKDSKVALELFPNQGMLYLMNGIAHNSLKNYTKAVNILNEGEMFTRTDSYMNVQLLSVLADAYNNLKQYEDSDAAFEKALKKDPNNPLILNNYSYFLSLRNEKLDQAEEMSKKSNLLQPRQASYQDTYAWILYQQNKYEEALEWILKALKNGGEKSGVIVEHYGDILFKLGEDAKAIEQWNAALELGDHSDELPGKIKAKKLP